MDKEKILSASRTENRRGDEMKKLNDMKAVRAAHVTMTVMNFLVLIYNFLCGDDIVKVICPILAGLSVLFLVEYRLNRRFLMLVLSCVFSVLSIASILLVVFNVAYCIHVGF